MKFVSPLCMLVILLVCHEAFGKVKVEAEGCTESDFPENSLKGCGVITKCTKFEDGTLRSSSGTGCGRFICEDGSHPLPGDPTKIFPGCCAYHCP